jgi:hypothetical protein
LNFEGMTPQQAAEAIYDDLMERRCSTGQLIGQITTVCQHFSNEGLMSQYLIRQRTWSESTFGPGKRTGGITAHIAKELEEIRKDPDDLTEWIDVIILGLDGYWRAGGKPEEFMRLLTAKQAKNFSRQWPPIAPEDQAVEHVREEASNA